MTHRTRRTLAAICAVAVTTLITTYWVALEGGFVPAMLALLIVPWVSVLPVAWVHTLPEPNDP